jgi:hypothetical protein
MFALQQAVQGMVPVGMIILYMVTYLMVADKECTRAERSHHVWTQKRYARKMIRMEQYR